MNKFKILILLSVFLLLIPFVNADICPGPTTLISCGGYIYHPETPVGTMEYFNYTINSPTFVTVKMTPNSSSTADYDLYTKWKTFTCPNLDSSDCGYPAGPGIQEICSETLSPGTYYITVHHYKGVGNGYTLELNCISTCNSDVDCTPDGWYLTNEYESCDGAKVCTNKEYEYRDYYCNPSVGCLYVVTDRKTEISNQHCEKGKCGAKCDGSEDCVNGVCQADCTCKSSSCEDSDGGKDYYTKGCVTVCIYNDQGGGCRGFCDQCNSDGTLTEGYCEGTEDKTITVGCRMSETTRYICSEGACVPERRSGSGCPILKAWDGESFVEVETLDIHAPRGEDTVYSIPVNIKPIDGQYKIILTEASYLLWEGSHIDNVKLTDEEGKECEIISAVHSKDGDVLTQLIDSDDVRIETKPGEELTLTFEGCEGEDFEFSIEGYNPWWRPVKLSLSSMSIIATLITIIVLVAIFGVFKFFVKR